MQVHTIEEVPSLLQQDDGFIWIDVRECENTAATFLTETFHFHPLAIQACREPTHLPKVHAYTEYLFIALQIPELGSDDHIHLLEMDQFLSRKFIVKY